MSFKLAAPQVKRRTILQALLSVSAFALFSGHVAPPEAEPKAEEFVEINGWILKRSELA